MRKGKCDGCGRIEWVNRLVRREAVVGEFCADCFEIEPHDNEKRSRTDRNRYRGRVIRKPVFEDFNDGIRALEGD